MEKYENSFKVLVIGMVVPVLLLNLLGDVMGIPTTLRHTIVFILILIQIVAVLCSVILIRKKMSVMKKKKEDFMKKFDETVEQKNKY